MSRQGLEPLRREVAVERERAVDPLAPHHLEAHPVHERHAAAGGGEVGADSRGVHFSLDPERRERRDHALEQVADRTAAEPPVHEGRRLHDDVVVRYERLARCEGRKRAMGCPPPAAGQPARPATQPPAQPSGR